jgi:hypothetical protein
MMPMGRVVSTNGGPATSSDQIVHSGWLIKSPPDKTIWRHKWKKTWFVLRAGNYPGQYLLQYFKQKSDKKPRGTIDLSQCEQVDAGLVFESRRVDFPFIFDIKTKDRTYYLVTQTEEEMNKWVKCICSLCGFKIKEDEENTPSVTPTATMDPTIERPVSSPATMHRRPAPVSPGQTQPLNNNPPNSRLHHTIASASRRTSSPALRTRHSSANTQSKSNNNLAASTFPLNSPEEDDERGPYIPLVECVSGHQAEQPVRPPAVSLGSSWRPHALPRPSAPRYESHNPMWYDVPPVNMDADSGPNDVYKDAPTGRGSIVEQWYQHPRQSMDAEIESLK